MLYIISFCIFGGAAAFGLLFLMYRRKIRNNTLNSKSIFIKAPSVIGVINLTLAAAFMLLYVLNPESFSPDQTIASPVAYILFTIFCTYFYIMALPLSIGYAAMTVILSVKQIISRTRFLVSISTNSLGAALLAILIYQVFG